MRWQTGANLARWQPLGRVRHLYCIGSIEMKRINPETNAFFRRGDVRHDGYVFFAYTNRKKAGGHFVEIWLNPEASTRALVNDRKRHRQKANGNRSPDARTNS